MSEGAAGSMAGTVAGSMAGSAANVGTIAVIGAGVTGRGIAQAAALAGYRTILEDLLPNALRMAETEIRAHLDEAVGRGALKTVDAAAALSLLEYADSIEQAARVADLVIESVPDELESKLEIFTMLDKICRPNTIFAANTSTLCISEIASVTYRAKKCVGMRFVNPVAAMKTLEIVRTLETDADTLAAVVEVGRRMCEKVVVLKDAPAVFPIPSLS